MKNKYLKSGAFVVAPAIMGSASPGNVSNAWSVGEVWEYIKSALWSLWAKMKFWETKKEDLNSNVEHENSLLNYEDFSDAKKKNFQEKDSSFVTKARFLEGIESNLANNLLGLKFALTGNKTLDFKEINTESHEISYSVVTNYDHNGDYNPVARDFKYRYSLVVFYNENYIQLQDFYSPLMRNLILFNPSKPYELRVFYAQGGSTLFDFSDKSYVKRFDFDQSGNLASTQDLGNNVPPIVEEIEKVILCINMFDGNFYNQFLPAVNNMGGFQGNNMRGAQNNNMINS